MTENKENAISQINAISRLIFYYENEKDKHKKAIEKLRKEKSILMMNGECSNNDRHDVS